MSRVSRAIGGGRVVLISGFDDDSRTGGLFAYDGRTAEQIDDQPTTGLTLHDDDLVRVLRAPESEGFDLVVHEAQGGSRRIRVEGHTDPHDVVWTGAAYAIACAGDNSIAFVSRDGEPATAWKADGEGDAWHLNSLLVLDGELHVTAFGAYERHRQWAETDASTDSGFVLNLTTGRPVLRGLSSPHHPRRLGSDWLVCNSGRRALTRIDATTGETRGEIVLEGWTRGLALVGDLLFVGESPGRTEPEGVSATIAVVDAASLNVVDRFGVAAREVYDIILAPASVARALS